MSAAEKTSHTPGPWRWEINLAAKTINLCGGDPKGGFGKYDLTVMGFQRWGMGGAAPLFVDKTGHGDVMQRADHFAEIVPDRAHHARWFQTLSHPDARLIAAAPMLLEALKECAESLRLCIKEERGSAEQDPVLTKALEAIASATGQV